MAGLGGVSWRQDYFALMKTKRYVFLCLLLLGACAQSSVNDGGGGAPGAGGAAPGETGGSGGTQSQSGGSGGVAGVAGGAGGSVSGGAGGILTGGAGGSAGANVPVVPVAAGNTYKFTFDGFVFVVDASLGGRVTEFSLNGKNVLSGPSANAENFGSTFWPSPQSVWNWPPPAEIDPGAYTARIDAGTLILEGKPSSRVNLAVTKRIAIDRAAQIVVMTYEMKNTGTAAATWAPWEITRVTSGGMTFFALGAGGTAAIGTWVPTPLQEAGMWRWYDDAALQTNNNQGRKTFADGTGWIAHVARNERLLLLKTFDDVAKDAQAKDEAELEIFVDGARKYVEVENQGTALPIGAGSTRTWTVRWLLRALPADAPLTVGSTPVINATKALLAK